MMEQLIQLKADVNEAMRFPSRSLMALLLGYQNLQYRLGSRRTGAIMGFHSYDATPLMMAVVTGQYEAALALIEAKARLDLTNARKKTALDLALELNAPSFLEEALMGESGVCKRMVASALNNRYIITEILWDWQSMDETLESGRHRTVCETDPNWLMNTSALVLFKP